MGFACRHHGHPPLPHDDSHWAHIRSPGGGGLVVGGGTEAAAAADSRGVLQGRLILAHLTEEKEGLLSAMVMVSAQWSVVRMRHAGI